jgi:hypothetical protein
MPNFLLSGFTWPIFAMPLSLQILAYALPMYPFVFSLRKITLMNAAPGDLLAEIGLMAAWAVAAAVLARLGAARILKSEVYEEVAGGLWRAHILCGDANPDRLRHRGNLPVGIALPPGVVVCVGAAVYVDGFFLAWLRDAGVGTGGILGDSAYPVPTKNSVLIEVVALAARSCHRLEPCVTC